MQRHALITPNRIYRYSLFREWGSGSPLLFVMLNPSTANEYKEDPTLKRCISFAKREGYGSLSVGNLFAYRTAYPSELLDAYKREEDITGLHNDSYLRGLRNHAANVIVAWGAVPAVLRWRIREVLQLLQPRALWCLGTTKSGDPRHPVRLAGSTPLELYRPHTSVIDLPPFNRPRDLPF